MHTKSDDIKIMIDKETDGIIRILFNSILQKYQNDSEKKLKAVNLFLIVLIYCGMNCIRPYIDSPKWLKNKKTINPKNNDMLSICFN